MDGSQGVAPGPSCAAVTKERTEHRISETFNDVCRC